MVTKQQQLAWLAHKYKTWPEQGSHSLRLSAFEVGKFAIVNCHAITKKEWQQERDKMQKKEEMNISGRLGNSTFSVNSNPANSWYERGELPPVGAVCECEGYAPASECEIVAYSDDQVCVRWRENKLLDVIDITSGEVKFSPLRTEQEKAIDEMVGILKAKFDRPGIDGIAVSDIVNELYDAGYRKVKP